MRTSAVIFFLFICITAGAITPGYLGKRLILYYGISGCPMTGAIYSGESVFDFNFKHQLGAEYILSKSRVIGLSGEVITDYLLLRNDEGYGSSPLQSIIYGWTWQLTLKRYNFKNRGSIAPVGWYRMCSFGYSHVEVTDNGRYFPTKRKYLGESSTPLFMFGYGKSTVWWDRITVDGSVRFGAAFSGLYKHYLADRDSYGMDEVTRKAAQKVFGSYLVGIHFMFGFLTL